MKYIYCLFVIICMHGCSHQITEGKIIGKMYEPANQWIQLIPITTCTGNMSITTMIPFVHYDDEDYIINVRGLNKKSEYVIERFYVTKAIYENKFVGENICFNPSCMENNDPIVKTKK